MMKEAILKAWRTPKVIPNPDFEACVDKETGKPPEETNCPDNCPCDLEVKEACRKGEKLEVFLTTEEKAEIAIQKTMENVKETIENVETAQYKTHSFRVGFSLAKRMILKKLKEGFK